jgi:hypothetical protein
VTAVRIFRVADANRAVIVAGMGAMYASIDIGTARNLCESYDATAVDMEKILLIESIIYPHRNKRNKG